MINKIQFTRTAFRGSDDYPTRRIIKAWEIEGGPPRPQSPQSDSFGRSAVPNQNGQNNAVAQKPAAAEAPKKKSSGTQGVVDAIVEKALMELEAAKQAAGAKQPEDEKSAEELAEALSPQALIDALLKKMQGE